jgi:Tannase and feruloyl esterase
VVRTRPLCAYPKVATYTGAGSTDDARNFICQTPFDYNSRWMK